MPKSYRKIPNWQVERRKSLGNARLRAAALAMFHPEGDRQRIATGLPDATGPDAFKPIPEMPGDDAGHTAAPRDPDRGTGATGFPQASEDKVMPKLEETKSTTVLQGPQGTKILNLTMRGLNPDAGGQVLRSGEPVYCGRYLCEVWDCKTEESRTFPGQFNDRFIGEFYFTDFMGQEHEGSNAWLPRRVGDRVKAKIEAGVKPAYEAGEIWCIPDPRGITAGKGYLYQPFNRQKPTRSRLWEIGVAAGIVDPSRLPTEPQRALPRPPMLDGEPNDGDEFDPETGEIAAQ